MVQLTFEDKLLIVAAATSIVCFTVLFMACKLLPFCYFYKFCPLRGKFEHDFDEERRKRKGELLKLKYSSVAAPSILKQQIQPCGDDTTERTKDAMSSSTLANSKVLSPATSLSSLPSGDMSPTLRRQAMLQRQQRSSLSTDCSSSTAASTTASGPLRAGLTSACSQAPEVEFGICLDKETQKLIVFVKGAKYVPLSFYGTSNDCYVKLYVIKDKKRRWRRRSQISLDEMKLAENGYSVTEHRTQISRRTTAPVFNDQFITDLLSNDYKYCSVKLVLFCLDRFSHETIVGETQSSVSRLSAGEMHFFSATLRDIAKDLGQLMISLTYLPTAERLCVHILKAINLKPPPSLKTANPYVRLTLVHRSKILEKLKTVAQSNTLNPSFNETLTFDLPKEETEKVTLIISVLHDTVSGRDVPKDSASADGGSGRHSDRVSIASSSGCGESVSANDETIFEETTPSSTASKSAMARESRRKSLNSVFEMTARSSSSAALFKSRSTSSVKTVRTTVVLGRVALGANAKDSGRAQWLEAVKCPRKQVALWHKLQQ